MDIGTYTTKIIRAWLFYSQMGWRGEHHDGVLTRALATRSGRERQVRWIPRGQRGRALLHGHEELVNPRHSVWVITDRIPPPKVHPRYPAARLQYGWRYWSRQMLGSADVERMKLLAYRGKEHWYEFPRRMEWNKLRPWERRKYTMHLLDHKWFRGSMVKTLTVNCRCGVPDAS